MTVNAAIIGPTGYTGYYLIDLLLRHPQVRITYLASRRAEQPNVGELFPQLIGRMDDRLMICRPIDANAIAAEADVVFCALPHRASMSYVPQMLEAGLKVVDLSGDYRLTDPAVYEKYYQHAHSDAANLSRAVYGLTELYRDKIARADLVANPGCYPTAAVLGIAPLLQRKLVKHTDIIANAAQGVSGAGIKTAQQYHFPEMNESFFPYGSIGSHRHQPEMQQVLCDVAAVKQTQILFVPHLLPLDRGELITIYLEPANSKITEDQLFEALEDAYDDERFVRVRQDLPNVKHVRDTNCCDITVRLTPDDASGLRKVVLFSAIDNMIKGASGQAIQNMNVMFNLDEAAGLC